MVFFDCLFEFCDPLFELLKPLQKFRLSGRISNSGMG
jgi:hypothetical protein